MQWITSGIEMWCPISNWKWDWGNNKRADQTWLAGFQHQWCGLRSLNESSCPWHLKMSCAPWDIENVYTGAHLVSRVHKHCRSASTGVYEAMSLSRNYSPPRMGLPSWKVQPLAIIPPGKTLDCSNTLLPMSPDGKWAESSPSSTGTVHTHSLQW